MKVLSLLFSFLAFGASAYFFAVDFRNSSELNYLIYMSMLLILMSICVVGMMINIPMLIHEKRKMAIFLFSKFSKNKKVKKERSIRLKKHNYTPNF